QHQVRIASPECLNPFQTVTGTIYCISFILQERTDNVLDSDFIFYNQNCLCHNSTSAIWTTVYHTKMEFWWSSPIFHTGFKLFIVFHFLRKKSQEITPLGHPQICIRLPTQSGYIRPANLYLFCFCI